MLSNKAVTERKLKNVIVSLAHISLERLVFLRYTRVFSGLTRLIQTKVAFKSEAEKNQIMENLKVLKGQERFRGMNSTDDYTRAERQMIKEYSEKAKENNNNEPQHSGYVWRVRGSPRNGLHLRKFLKQGPVLPI